MSTNEIISTITKPSAAGTKYGDLTVEELPIMKFIADLISRMNWNPSRFSIYRNYYLHICFRVDEDDDCSVVLHGFNYAHQVNAVMQVIKDAGLFN